MRAGLNVAALQCQFSPYLRAVSNYNDILTHHSKELAGAYDSVLGYFERTKGGVKQGQKAFDDYTTTTYNNFSTLHAQTGFCQTAADIGKDALTRPKGGLGTLALGRMRELRNSLVPAYDQFSAYKPQLVRMPAMPPLDEKCWDGKGRLKSRCATRDFAAAD